LLNYTLPELLALPSTFKKNPKDATSPTTVILNHWRRKSLEQQLKALHAQTLRPRSVWVCLFNSDKEEFYSEIVSRYTKKFKGGVFIVKSNYNFKYFGRFQLALQVATPYVWIVDDDVLPGKNYLEILTHVGGISDLKGIYGSTGWLMPGHQGNEKGRKLPSYRDPEGKGLGLYFPDFKYRVPNQVLMAVDLLCSQWFLQTDYVRLLFREQLVTYETAEDYHLAYNLRKYAGVQSYVLPMDITDSRTWGNIDTEQALQAVEATTTMDMVGRRVQIWGELVSRGGQYFWLKYEEDAVAQQSERILLFVDSKASVKPLAQLYKQMYKVREAWELEGESRAPDFTDLLALLDGQAKDTPIKISKRLSGDIMVAFSGASKKMCKNFVESANFEKQLGIDACSGRLHGFFDLRLGRDYPFPLRPHDIYSHFLKGLSEVAQSSRTGGIVCVKENSTYSHLSNYAMQALTELENIPVLCIPSSQIEQIPWISAVTSLALKAWGSLKVQLMVFAEENIEQQLLTSILLQLNTVHFLGDRVDVVMVCPFNTTMSADIDSVAKMQTFEWEHGFQRLERKYSTALTISDFLESWLPSSGDDFLFVFDPTSSLPASFYLGVKLFLVRNALAAASWITDGFGACLNFGSDNVYIVSSFHWKNLLTDCNVKDYCLHQQLFSFLSQQITCNSSLSSLQYSITG